MPRILPLLVLLALFPAGCKKYVPANLPLDLTDPAVSEDQSYEDDLGRTIGSADAEGPEYRLTMADGTRFFMKGPRMRGDSVVGYYRPQKGTPWARAAVPVYEVRRVEEQTIDWLATSSLIVTPITLALLLTY